MTTPECVTLYTEEDMYSRELVVAATVKVPPLTHHFRVPINAPYILQSSLEQQLKNILTVVTRQIVTEYKEKANEVHRQAQRW